MDAPLYFVPILVQCYLVFTLLYRFSTGGRRIGKCAILFVVLLVSHACVGILAYTGQFAPHSPLPVIRSFAFWGVYFYAGVLLGLGILSAGPLHCIRRLGAPLLLAAAVALYCATAFLYLPQQFGFLVAELMQAYVRPIIMVYNALCVWIIALIILDDLPISNRLIGWIGKNSLIVFLWHMPILHSLAVYTTIHRLTVQCLLLLPIVIIATAAIAALGSELWQSAKVRIFRYMEKLNSSDDAPGAS